MARFAITFPRLGLRSEARGLVASLGKSVKTVAAVPVTPVRFATTATGAVECALSAGTTRTPAMATALIWPGPSPGVGGDVAHSVPDPARVSQTRVGGRNRRALLRRRPRSRTNR